MTPRLAPTLRTIAAALFLTIATASSAAPGRRGEVARPASVSTTISATREEVHKAVLEALATWTLRKESLEEGIVKTEWVNRPRGDAMYRGRIVAEHVVDGYQVRLSVKHEKQYQMRDMRPTLGGPSATWADTSGDYDIARAVATAVEQALGQEAPAIKLGERALTSAMPVEIQECIVPPDAAARIVELKSRRRDLVTEVKAMDARLLAAVYDGKYDAIKDDVDKLKARKAMMESQITEIDREILALVVAD